jgi:hypothetical protein
MSGNIFAAVAAVVGAYGEYQSGQAKKRMYDMQAKQVTVEAERKAVQYRQQANQVLRKQASTNSAIIARGYAGGVDPFSGSGDVARRAVDTAAGREFEIVLANADAALRGGAIQAKIYEAAGDQAGRAGAFNAAYKLASAAAGSGGSSSSTQSPAEVFEAGSAPQTAPR